MSHSPIAKPDTCSKSQMNHSQKAANIVEMLDRHTLRDQNVKLLKTYFYQLPEHISFMGIIILQFLYNIQFDADCEQFHIDNIEYSDKMEHYPIPLHLLKPITILTKPKSKTKKGKKNWAYTMKYPQHVKDLIRNESDQAFNYTSMAAVKYSGAEFLFLCQINCLQYMIKSFQIIISGIPLCSNSVFPCGKIFFCTDGIYEFSFNDIPAFLTMKGYKKSIAVTIKKSQRRQLQLNESIILVHHSNNVRSITDLKRKCKDDKYKEIFAIDSNTKHIYDQFPQLQQYLQRNKGSLMGICMIGKAMQAFEVIDSKWHTIGSHKKHFHIQSFIPFTEPITNYSGKEGVTCVSNIDLLIKIHQTYAIFQAEQYSAMVKEERAVFARQYYERTKKRNYPMLL